MTLYAEWIPTNLTITLDANGGVVTPNSLFVPYGSKYGKLPVPTSNPDNTFIGWFTAGTGGTEVTSNTYATQSMILYAHWEPQTAVTWGYIIFDINLQTNGGTLDSSYESFYYYGTTKALPNSSQIIYQGKSFVGWYDNPSFLGTIKTTIPSGESGVKTYYAKWE